MQHTETPLERWERQRQESLAANSERIASELPRWNPADDPHASGDAYKTLFVGRLAYETTENKLTREFAEFGRIVKVSRSSLVLCCSVAR